MTNHSSKTHWLYSLGGLGMGGLTLITLLSANITIAQPSVSPNSNASSSLSSTNNSSLSESSVSSSINSSSNAVSSTNNSSLSESSVSSSTNSSSNAVSSTNNSSLSESSVSSSTNSSSNAVSSTNNSSLSESSVSSSTNSSALDSTAIPINVPQPPLFSKDDELRQGDNVMTSDKSLYDLYPLALKKGQTIVISLESSEFDPYLALLDSQGKVIAENDDLSPQNSNSQITYTVLQNGNYRIFVNSYNPQGKGKYSLTVIENNSLQSAQTPANPPNNPER